MSDAPKSPPTSIFGVAQQAVGRLDPGHIVLLALVGGLGWFSLHVFDQQVAERRHAFDVLTTRVSEAEALFLRALQSCTSQGEIER
jgi:hypothetical protein